MWADIPRMKQQVIEISGNPIHTECLAKHTKSGSLTPSSPVPELQM
jgi:hypothetical protein